MYNFAFIDKNESDRSRNLFHSDYKSTIEILHKETDRPDSHEGSIKHHNESDCTFKLLRKVT